MTDKTKNRATVSHVPDDYRAVINRGSLHGVKAGDVYLIYSIGPELFDPDTNESLGRLEEVRGRAKVTHVQEKIATLRSIEFEETHGSRKIIRRDSGIAMFGQQREEIEEGAKRVNLSLDAEVGDQAKLLSSA
ncbi:hypothetical protein HCZ30_00675 [Marivivens donghaensis]|uniref:Uncharacterized protein n=1 Tax=Marivivens donghaensis TaxID=1699413 RepID=A0ABX0VVR4_9RHOB|nr:hypothetical protein [Marivivens donghaensis]NIY70944.1 hypothetical protein [Marivivens donghaensis]